jgi:hydroxymethylbilane synthase
VRELDAALLDGDVDCAVHSAKDVPGAAAEGIVIAAVPPRADPRDALCGAPTLARWPTGARVGTSSLRRAAQLRALRDDLDVRRAARQRRHPPAQARRRRLRRDRARRAGLERLGRGDAGTPLDELVPAAGQGCLAVTTRAGEERWSRASTDRRRRAALAAERALVRALEADCHTPVGAHARPRARALRCARSSARRRQRLGARRARRREPERSGARSRAAAERGRARGPGA